MPWAEDFEEHYNEERQASYFWDKTTGETKWERPWCLAISLDPPDLPPPPLPADSALVEEPRIPLSQPPTMNPHTADLGAVEETRNVLTFEMTYLDLPKVKRDCSATHLKEKPEGHAEKHGDLIAEEMAGKGLGEADAVNQGPLAKVLSGQGARGLLETISVSIGFLLNFGMVVEIDIPWPESFKAMPTWLEIFSLDFTIFGGAQLGLCTSIWTGLLVPPWLISMFDASWRRKFGKLFFDEDVEIMVFGGHDSPWI